MGAALGAGESSPRGSLFFQRYEFPRRLFLRRDWRGYQLGPGWDERPYFLPASLWPSGSHGVQGHSILGAFEPIRRRRPQLEGRGLERSDLFHPRPTGSGRRAVRAERKPRSNCRRAYQDILDREPDSAGLRLYRSRIIDDGWTEAQVRDALRKSPEYRENSTMTVAKAQDIARRAYLRSSIANQTLGAVRMSTRSCVTSGHSRTWNASFAGAASAELAVSDATRSTCVIVF